VHAILSRRLSLALRAGDVDAVSFLSSVLAALERWFQPTRYVRFR
jgi:hypothetical protein